ncbi:MAG: Mth938-like domain-containing protein [Steroidobacteraceae bacterium]
MRLALDSDPRVNLVRRYGDGEIVIGAQRIVRACIVAPNRLMLDWTAGSFEELSEAPLEPAQLTSRLEPLLLAGAGIVLLGSGLLQPFPSARLRAAFRERNIALECMTLGAACRTYNILATEERSVIAGLFP